MGLFDNVNFPDEPADTPETCEEELEAENEILRGELIELRADLANVTAEYDALVADLTKYKERIAQMQIDYVALEVAHDAIEEQLKQYQRMAARR